MQKRQNNCSEMNVYLSGANACVIVADIILEEAFPFLYEYESLPPAISVNTCIKNNLYSNNILSDLSDYSEYLFYLFRRSTPHLSTNILFKVALQQIKINTIKILRKAQIKNKNKSNSNQQIKMTKQQVFNT